MVSLEKSNSVLSPSDLSKMEFPSDPAAPLSHDMLMASHHTNGGLLRFAGDLSALVAAAAVI